MALQNSISLSPQDSARKHRLDDPPRRRRADTNRMHGGSGGVCHWIEAPAVESLSGKRLRPAHNGISSLDPNPGRAVGMLWAGAARNAIGPNGGSQVRVMPPEWEI
jgi:hypothetical protein